MPADRPTTRLTGYARLPRPYRDRHVVHSTVDARGRAHWLVTDRPPQPGRRKPYDAVMVTVEDGRPYETHLSVVPWRFTVFDVLPDGGFVVASTRSRTGEQHVQVFDALGRPSWTFRVGDAISQFLADATGDLWVGYFDEGVYGDDELSFPGLRRWSGTGEPLWRHEPGPGHGDISDLYALNVADDAVWACPYQDFPLLEIRGDRVVRALRNPVHGAYALAVHGDRVVFLGRYRADRSEFTECRLTWDAVEPVASGPLVRPDGEAFDPRLRHHVVCRGPRLYLQEEPYTEWAVLDLAVS
ncbi:hypothetical protein ACFV6E_39265 [Streptomyces sp. NPDC059785]|uniref:hypothetical protein n=1 Tax=unclassified Streptomyces TaxID=2593676 RepID=UPI0036506D7F